MTGIGIYLLMSQDPVPESNDSAQSKLPAVLPTLSIDSDGATAGALLRF